MFQTHPCWVEKSELPGPLVVGVDASRWDLYGHGVFDGCDRDATINHAVVLVGRYWPEDPTYLPWRSLLTCRLRTGPRGKRVLSNSEFMGQGCAGCIFGILQSGM